MHQSPYLDRLTREIESATDPTVRGRKRAERAACFARLGDFQAAEAEITDLRTEFGDGRDGRVSIMIMWTEAQLIYFQSLGQQARDRMLRAQLLSIAGRDAELSALTSSWVAHIAFNLHRHDEMVRAAKTCLDTISKTDSVAAIRLALTLGDAFYASEQLDLGNRWYAKAHEHAVRLGDHAMIAALTYNRAAMGTFVARLRSADAPVAQDLVRRLTGEVRTAINYQAVAQLTSLQSLLDYSLSSVLILGEKWPEARDLLSGMVELNPGTSPVDRPQVLRSDLALCLAKSAQVEEARLAISNIDLDGLASSTADDQVVALAALAETARILGDAALAAQIETRLTTAKSAYREEVRQLRNALAAFAQQAALEKL